MSADTNSNNSDENDDFQSETQLCLGNLDYIDSILSKFETTNDVSITKADTQDKSVKIETKVLDVNKSPLVSEKSFSNSSRNVNSSFRKTKSMYFTSTKNSHSTPKAALSKELEFLSNLYNEGSLNDSNTEITVDVNTESRNIRTDTYETKSCKVSPIVTNYSQGILRNNKPLSQETPSSNKKNVKFDNKELDNVNRNLEFDDDVDMNDKRSIGTRLESVKEDEELLAHLSDLEDKKILTNSMQCGFQTAKGTKITVNPKVLASIIEKANQEDEIVTNKIETANHSATNMDEFGMKTSETNKENLNLLQVGFKTASHKNITVKSDTIDSIKNIFKENDCEMNVDNSNNFQIGFKTASDKVIPIKAEALNNAKMLLKDEDFGFKPSDSASNFKIGFKTANNKPIQVKIDSINNVKMLLKDEDFEPKSDLTNNFQLGFKTASEKSIIIKPDSINNAKKLIEDDDLVLKSDNFQLGFKTANDQPVKIKPDAFKKAKGLLSDEDLRFDQNDFQVGFKTANNKSIPIKLDSFNNAKNLLNNEDFQFNQIALGKNVHTNYQDCEMNVDNSNNFQIGFKTASDKVIPIKAEALNNAKMLLKDEDFGFKANDSKNIQIGFKTANDKPIEIKPDSINTVKMLLKDEDFGIKPNESTSNFQVGFKTASEKSITIKPDSINNVKNLIKDNESNETTKPIENNIDLSLNVSNKEINRPKISRLSLDPGDISINQKCETNAVDNSSILNGSKLNLSVNVPKTAGRNGKIFKRPQLLDKTRLNKYIESNESVINNDDITDSVVEESITKEMDCQDISFKSNSQSIELNNVFTLSDCSSLKLKEIKIEKTSDNIYIVRPIFELSNLDSKYIKFECSITSNSSDPNIEKTFEINQLTSLNTLLKRLEAKRSVTLSTNERSKSGYLFELKSNKTNSRFSLEQMKLNRDSSVKFDLNVLKFNIKDFFVINEISEAGYVKTQDNGWLIADKFFFIAETELYNCFLDSKGVDTKLVNIDWFKNHLKWISWKLYSYDSRFKNAFTQSKVFTPLNILSQIKYRYDVEVGRARRSCIKKIVEKDDTSTNKLLILFVSNVFDTNSSSNMVFIELSDGWYPIKALCDAYLTTFIRNNRIRVGDKLALFSSELVGSPKDGCPPLEAPEEMHLKLSVNSVRKARWFAKLGFSNPQKPLTIALDTIKQNSIVGAIDVVIERIYPISYIETAPDGSKVYRNQKQEEMHSFNSQRCNEDDSEDRKPNSSNASNITVRRNVSELLKVRVADFSTKKISDKQASSCLITIWQNASSLKEQLTEGQRLVFLNLNAISPKNSFQETTTIQLSTTRQTSFIFYKNKKGFKSNRYNCEYEDVYNQNIESVYNEIDICGVVLMQSSNNYQNIVYLTNLKEKLSIICLCFPKQSNFYGFKEVLKYSNTIACLNLKFIRKKENNKYPCLLATENSVFTQKLSIYKFLTDPFNLLNNLLNKPETNCLKKMLQNLQDDLINPISSAISSSMNKPIINLNSSQLNKSTNKGLSHPSNSSQNNQSENEKKLLAIAELADSPLFISKNGIKQPGLVSKAKQFQAPAKLIKEEMNRSLIMATNTVRSLKRTSLSIETERAINPSLDDDDDETQLMLNQDFEALFQTANHLNKRKKI